MFVKQIDLKEALKMTAVPPPDGDWVLVSEDLPVIAPGYTNLTADVYVKFTDGLVGIGYFNYRNGLWYSMESKEYHEGDIVAWRSMDEDEYVY